MAAATAEAQRCFNGHSQMSALNCPFMVIRGASVDMLLRSIFMTVLTDFSEKEFLVLFEGGCSFCQTQRERYGQKGVKIPHDTMKWP